MLKVQASRGTYQRRIRTLGFGPSLNACAATWSSEAPPAAAALHKKSIRIIGGGILMVADYRSQCRADGGLLAAAAVARDATFNPPLHQSVRFAARR